MTPVTYEAYRANPFAVRSQAEREAHRARTQAMHRLLIAPLIGLFRRTSSSLVVNARWPARIRNARGLRLRVEAGSVWITEEGRFDDVYVPAGGSHRIERDGLTLVSALKAPFALVTLDASAS